MAGPVNVYLSHSADDKEIASQLAKHLRPQLNEGLIQLELDGGSVAEDRADVILMLMSPDYLPKEGDLGPLDRALYLRRRKGTWVVPVLLHSVDLSPIRPPLRPLPHNRVPVSEWPHVNAALADVALGVREVAERITEARSAPRRPEGAPAPAEAPLIYLCAHEADGGHLRALERHLRPYEVQERTRLWTPDRLLPGEPTDEDGERFGAARVIVLLLSADFLSSPELMAQTRRAVDRHHRSEATIIAVRVRPIAELPLLLSDVPMLPADGRAVSSAADPDEAWSGVVRQILGHLDPQPGPQTHLADLSAWAARASKVSYASFEHLRREFDASAAADPPRFTDRVMIGDAELWATARAETAAGEHRIGCLLELSRRGAPGLPAFLAERLAELRAAHALQDQDTTWRDGLLMVLEQTQVTDPALRARLAELLLSYGRRLRDAGAEGAVCPVLRRLATLLPGAQAGPLVGFLREQDVPLTRQAALQAIQVMFSQEPPAGDDELPTLRERVRAIALHSLDPERAQGVAEASLAVSALRAALALDDPAAPDLIDALIALGRPHMLWLCLDQLANMLRAWERQPGPAVERLRERLGRLRAALSQGITPGA